jgi:hypothetical protein
MHSLERKPKVVSILWFLKISRKAAWFSNNINQGRVSGDKNDPHFGDRLSLLM